MVTLYESIKLSSLCHTLSIDGRTARLYSFIHETTGGGTRPEALELWKKETIDDKLRKLYFLPGFRGSELEDDIRRVYTDAEYRRVVYGKYTEMVLPRLQNYTLKDVLRVVFDKHFHFRM